MLWRVLAFLALSTLCVAHRPQGWCGTEFEPPSSSTRLARAVVDDDTCGAKVDCDAAAFRDLYQIEGSMPFVIVRTWWVVTIPRNPSPSFKADAIQKIEDNMLLMNKSYFSLSVQFTHDITFVNDTKWAGSISREATTMLKEEYSVNWRTHINIFSIDLIGPLGFATFPWTQTVGTKQHGIVLRHSYVNNKGYTLVHEMGHELGLLHTHQSVSGSRCDVCLDTAQSKSNLLGDLVADTPPTPVNYDCEDVTSKDGCTGFPWAPTDYKNWMGYSDDDCMVNGHFTEQQWARIRCYTLNGLQTYIEFEECETPGDCQIGNNCFRADCVRGVNGTRKHCRYNQTVCSNGDPCSVGTCDPANGQCTFSPRQCRPAQGLEDCAIPSCNPRTGKCRQDITKCEGGGVFDNDCCVASPTPFCKNKTIAECVCNTQSHCCYNQWDKSCVDTVVRCGRACLPPPPPFYNDGRPYSDTIYENEVQVQRGMANYLSKVSCPKLKDTAIEGYGAWYRSPLLGTKNLTFIIDTCDPDPVKNPNANHVPTGVLFIDSNDECVEWTEEPEDCDGRVKINFPFDGNNRVWAFVYVRAPAALTIYVSIKAQ